MADRRNRRGSAAVVGQLASDARDSVADSIVVDLLVRRAVHNVEREVVRNRPPTAALTSRSGCDTQLWHLREEIPGQQLFDLIDGMIGDALKDVTQVVFGVDVVEFCGTE